MNERLNALIEKVAQRMETIDTTKLSIPELSAFMSIVSVLRLTAWETTPSPYDYGFVCPTHNASLDEKQKED